LPFVSQPKAVRLVSSLRMGAVVLREERESLTIDSPLAIAELCSEMRFLDRESLRVILLNAKQHGQPSRKLCICRMGTLVLDDLQREGIIQSNLRWRNMSRKWTNFYRRQMPPINPRDAELISLFFSLALKIVPHNLRWTKPLRGILYHDGQS
jgi:hypothetical protein